MLCGKGFGRDDAPEKELELRGTRCVDTKGFDQSMGLWIALIVCIALSAFFSATETAFYASSMV